MIEIRRASAKDAADILEYCKIIGGESDNLTYDNRGLPISVEEEINFLNRIENSDRQIFLIALEGGEIIGSANYSGFGKERLAHRGEIGMSVRKDKWGQGIGTLLMEKLLDFAKETAKAEIVSLEVRSDNQAAIHLYRKFGFEKIGVFKGFMKIEGKWIDFDLMNLYL